MGEIAKGIIKGERVEVVCEIQSADANLCMLEKRKKKSANIYRLPPKSDGIKQQK